MKFFCEQEQELALRIEFLKEAINDKEKDELCTQWENERLDFYRHLYGELLWERS